MKNLVLIDTGSVYYSILNALSIGGKTKRLVKDYVAQIKFNVLYLLSGTYLHQLGYMQPYQILFLQDCKPYWREGLLQKFDINYKGKRGKQGWREDTITTIKSVFNSTLTELGIKPVSLWASKRINNKMYGYEADDLAAGVIKTIGADYGSIFTLTVDTDWLPFTANPKVHWLNTGSHTPRVRRFQEALEYCKNCTENIKTKDRKEFIWHTPLDLWKFKAEFGDTSDNLCGNRKLGQPNFFDPYVDLYNCVKSFQCWSEPGFRAVLLDSLTSIRLTPTPFYVIQENNQGCQYAVPPFDQVSMPYNTVELKIEQPVENLQELQIARASLGI